MQATQAEVFVFVRVTGKRERLYMLRHVYDIGRDCHMASAKNLAISKRQGPQRPDKRG